MSRYYLTSFEAAVEYITTKSLEVIVKEGGRKERRGREGEGGKEGRREGGRNMEIEHVSLYMYSACMIVMRC